MTERDDRHLLTGAYALNALTDAERKDFEAYLLESDETRTEVAEMSDTAVMLGLSSRPVAPSAELKASIMGMLDSTPQFRPMQDARPSLRSVPTTSDRSAGAGSNSDAEKINRIASGATGSAENRAKAAWFRKPIGLITAAAAAIAIFLSGSVIGLNLNDRGYEQQQAASLAELTAAADLESATAAVQGGGDAKVIWSIDLERSAVLIDGLPALEDGKTYQLWYIDQNGPRGAGTFDVSSDEPTAWRVLDGAMSSVDSVGLTVEPSGGSDAPTTDPILVVGA